MSGSTEKIQFKQYSAKFSIFEERAIKDMRLNNQDIYRNLQFGNQDISGAHTYVLDGDGRIRVTSDGSYFEEVDLKLTAFGKDSELAEFHFDKICSNWIELINDIFGMNFQWEALRSAQQA